MLGVDIDATDPEHALATFGNLVARRAKGYLVFCTVSTILNARRDPQLKEAIAKATLVTPDGVPLVWLGRRDVDRDVGRVYGPDFMLHVFEKTGSDFSHFFYGGAPGVAEDLVDQLKKRFPTLVVTGSHSPPPNLGPTGDQNGVNRINAAAPDVVWVGLGHPKQELWMAAHRDHLDAPVLAGVGAAFDFLSGRKREAPEWMKRSGLQWLHRLVSEPRRLWRRYLLGNTQFVLLLLRERWLRKGRPYKS